MKVKEQELSGWGRLPRSVSSAFRPERLSVAARAVKSNPKGGLIARGAGRSYGDAALNGGGHVLLTPRLDRILAFDPESRELVCEPGISIAELQNFLVPKGYALPVVPGTGFATVGGAVANDIHGKNHDKVGSFGDHLRWFDLLMADGTFLRVSPDDDADLFAATVGGVGLTGILMTVCVAVMPCPSNAVRVTEMRAEDLDHFMTLLSQHRDRETYSVGWIDALAHGAQLGRGILEVAEPSEEPVEAPPPRRLRVPVDMPSFVLNRWSISAMNALYFNRIPALGRDRLVSLDRFFHPLDAVLDWNRMYGKGGFRQFQCVFPDATAPAGLRCMLEAVSDSRAASFLAVLKTMGGEGRGHLSFPMRGFTLALDFPARAGTDELLKRLEAITLEHRGRVYLAKDSCLSAAGFAAMYPKLPDFRAVLDRVDPEAVFVSDLARRLGIRGEAT